MCLAISAITDMNAAVRMPKRTAKSNAMSNGKLGKSETSQYLSITRIKQVADPSAEITAAVEVKCNMGIYPSLVPFLNASTLL